MFIAFLLATTTSLVVLLSYKVHTLKKDRDRLLNENNEEAKVLFLQSRYASMGETVGNIAHQWKQPLNAIGAIQNSIKASLIFQGDISKEKLLSSVETSFKLLQHLAETIDTFYSFLAQRGDGKKSFIIADELEKVRKITEYSFENSNITLNFILDANPTIQGNANEFTHAILNLILNAKDAFDDSTSDMPIITVHVSGRENYCTIVICDTAGGIRLNPVEMVFDMHITTKESGSGLGLFMTKKIIEQRFGGSISVENRHDGACFTIELPYAEYGDYFNEASTHDEMLTLERINHLSRKVIELEDLEKTLKKWSDIFKQAHWGIAMHSEKDNTFELTNAAFNTLYGYSAQELKSIRVSDLFTSDSLPMLSKIQQEAKNKGFVVFEAVHKRKDGSTFPASVELIVIKNDEGEVLYHIANIWDLTEKKEAEERLLLKKFALDHIQDAVFMIDENARFHYVNQGACTALGYSREEFESMNVGDVDPDWPAERWNEHWEILKELGSITMELRHRRKDGTIFPVEVSANYIEFGDKHYNMAIARDITERKAAEKELLLVDKALNNTTEAAYIFINEHVVQVNDGACKMLGYSREELISMTLFDFDKELTKEGLASLKDNHKPNASFRFERQHTTKEGRILNVEIDASQFEYDGVTYSFTTVRDITEQKQAREELLLKEFALNTINEAVYLIDENSMFHYVNEGACTALGYTKEELMQKGVIHIDPNATPEWWNQHWNDLKEQKNMFIEASHRRKDGTLFPIELSINYFEYNGIGYNLAVARDITERRLLEEQKDNERMRLFFERQLVGMAIISPEYGWIHTNEKLQQMLGYTQDELTKRTWVDMTYPEDLAPELEQYRKLMNGEIEDYTLEKRLIRKDGNLVYTNLAVSCVRNDEGSVNYILALLEDISERKQMQAQLIASEREFRSLTEHIPDNIIRWDRYGRYLYINPVHERTLGLRSSEVIGHRIPDEHESIKAAIAQVVTSGQTILVQQSVPDENGDIRIHDVTLVPEWDDKGEIVSILGLGRDMTDIYRLQNDLEKHRSSLVEAQKLAKIGSWDFDLKTNNLSWSDEYFQILELDPTNDPNAVASFETFFERVHPEDREFVSERFNAWQMSMEPYNTEHRLLMPDGRVKFVHQLGGIRCDQNGTPLYAMGTVHDITERKVMETALQESNDRYIQILDNSSDVIYLLDVTPQGRFIYVDVNAAYEEVTGIPRDVVIGLDVEDIEDETFRNILIDKFTTVLNSGEKTDYTADYPFPAGVRTFHSILLPIRDESGRIVRIVGAARDITERQE
ncbi:PAS domain S-box protein, partial [Sulfuricurvum sp.]|uniref:PAS domain S-box protein n=1 Tax=Sulfuricurvum sp. TaxID=2025608 RepID=UPI002E375406